VYRIKNIIKMNKRKTVDGDIDNIHHHKRYKADTTIVFKASPQRRLSGKTVSRGKASRRLDIRSKATVAAPRTRRERGGGGGEEETWWCRLTIRRRQLTIRRQQLGIRGGGGLTSSCSSGGGLGDDGSDDGGEATERWSRWRW
jgi:hypothetical protein